LFLDSLFVTRFSVFLGQAELLDLLCELFDLILRLIIHAGRRRLSLCFSGSWLLDWLVAGKATPASDANRTIHPFGLRLLELIHALIDFLLLFLVDGWQEVLHDIVLPVVDRSVPICLLLLQVHTLDLQASRAFKVPKGDLVKLLSEQFFAACVVEH